MSGSGSACGSGGGCGGSSSSGSGAHGRVVRSSRQEGLVPVSSSPVIQDAATPERDAKKRRIDLDADRVVDESPGTAGRRGSLPPTPPSRRLTRKTSLNSDGPSPTLQRGAATADAALSGEARVGVRDSEMGGGRARLVRGRGRGRGGCGGSVEQTAAADVVGARGPARGGRQGAATGPSASAAEERRGRAGDAAVVTDTVPVRRSARVAARSEGVTTIASGRGRGAGGGRIVSGFGAERVEDVAADQRRRIAEGAQRGDERRVTGARGRMTDHTGADLDRGAGGAWHAGRR